MKPRRAHDRARSTRAKVGHRQALISKPNLSEEVGFLFFGFDQGAIFLGFCFNLREKQHLRDTISFFVSSDPGDLRWSSGEADASGARRDLPVVLKDCVTRLSILDPLWILDPL